MIRVLIADDNAVLRRGLKDILKYTLVNTCFGEADSADQVLRQLENQEWDILILDIGMPDRSGVDVLREVRKIGPLLPILILSMHPEHEYGKRVLTTGASGYVRKDCAAEELVVAIQKVLSGQQYMSAALAEHLAREQNAPTDDHPAHKVLSKRELEILRWLGSGKTVGEIAAQLKLSVATVSTYRARILKKMDMTTTAQLIHYALRNHLVD
ncbi:MAG TPA: response regulator transcription factor [Bryobacteraceae bacterium]|nr:response regulator transcription factor [Bryobacteraceae bacterium]